VAVKKSAKRNTAHRSAAKKKAAKKKASTKKTAKKKTAKKKAAKKKASTKKTAKKKAAKKKASTKKTAKKKASKKKASKKTSKKKAGAKRGPGRPPGGDSKTRGSKTSRRQVRRIAQLILKEAKGRTREEASERTGAHVDDIKNLKAGNLPSLKLVLRVVRNGRCDPNVLIAKHQLKKLPAGVSTKGARAEQIAARIRKLAKESDPAELAAKTGLSIYTIYQHRVAGKRVGLHTILAFVDAGVVTASQIFLGR
jgi:hypothetical protein